MHKSNEPYEKVDRPLENRLKADVTISLKRTLHLNRYLHRFVSETRKILEKRFQLKLNFKHLLVSALEEEAACSAEQTLGLPQHYSVPVNTQMSNFVEKPSGLRSARYRSILE